MQCKKCGGPISASNKHGYCRKNPECNRVGTRVRQQMLRGRYGAYLYALFNAAGQVIYIGESSMKFTLRLSRHKRDNRDWWPEVTSIKVAPAPLDKAARRELEHFWIHKWHPEYNNRCDYPNCGYAKGGRAQWRKPEEWPPISEVETPDELF